VDGAPGHTEPPLEAHWLQVPPGIPQLAVEQGDGLGSRVAQLSGLPFWHHLLVAVQSTQLLPHLVSMPLLVQLVQVPPEQ
jgi:hypothetical protein